MPVVDMICMANSHKENARCVAGLRTGGEGWIRPVDAAEGGVVPLYQQRLEDGTQPRVLDHIQYEVLAPVPTRVQPENWLLRKDLWKLVRRPASPALIPLVQAQLTEGPELLGSRGDCVAHATFIVSPARQSLTLVRPTDLSWYVEPAGSKKKARARFSLKGQTYQLAITDPDLRGALLQQGAGTALTENREVFLTISLGEPYKGYCYKLVAAVWSLPDEWRVWW
jgi:hypothetical protein